MFLRKTMLGLQLLSSMFLFSSCLFMPSNNRSLKLKNGQTGDGTQEDGFNTTSSGTSLRLNNIFENYQLGQVLPVRLEVLLGNGEANVSSISYQIQDSSENIVHSNEVFQTMVLEDVVVLGSKFSPGSYSLLGTVSLENGEVARIGHSFVIASSSGELACKITNESGDMVIGAELSFTSTIDSDAEEYFQEQKLVLKKVGANQIPALVDDSTSFKNSSSASETFSFSEPGVYVVESIMKGNSGEEGSCNLPFLIQDPSSEVTVNPTCVLSVPQGSNKVDGLVGRYHLPESTVAVSVTALVPQGQELDKVFVKTWDKIGSGGYEESTSEYEETSLVHNFQLGPREQYGFSGSNTTRESFVGCHVTTDAYAQKDFNLACPNDDGSVCRGVIPIVDPRLVTDGYVNDPNNGGGPAKWGVAKWGEAKWAEQ